MIFGVSEPLIPSPYLSKHASPEQNLSRNRCPPQKYFTPHATNQRNPCVRDTPTVSPLVENHSRAHYSHGMGVPGKDSYQPLEGAWVKPVIVVQKEHKLPPHVCKPSVQRS